MRPVLRLRAVGGLAAALLALATPVLGAGVAATAAPAASAASAASAATGWRLVVDDQFGGTTLPSHWQAYDGRFSSGAKNCARPDQAVVRGGLLRVSVQHRTTGRCGSAWYSAAVRLTKPFTSIDERVAVRFRVVSVGGFRAHRNVVMRYPASGLQKDGEENYCETTRLHICRTWLHNGTTKIKHDTHVNVTRWHTLVAERRGFTARLLIDGRLRYRYVGNATTLPRTGKRLVIQEECPLTGCPSGTSGREVLLVNWIKVWNPA